MASLSQDDGKNGLSRESGDTGETFQIPTGLSRRRMAFRPPTSQSRPATATGLKAPPPAGPSTSNELTAPSSSTVTEEANASKLTFKRGKMWSHEEIMIYYEAVKQFGKDFDNITKWVAKRKVHKCKDQIKNFYFNSIKFIRTSADLDVDDQFAGICRDAKELFLVINACEWRKKTGTSKYQADRLRELILEGSTTIRSKKKSLVIKTPPCPALNKYFTKNRRFDREKFPSDIILKLMPKTYADASYLISKEKNPLIKFKINCNDRISRIFKLLFLKWGSRTEERNDGTNPNFNLTLYPSEKLELGNVVLEMGPPESTTISLNRLRREVDETNSAKENGASSYSLIVSNPLSIDSKVLTDGLTMKNCTDTTAAELYCLCGMATELTFVYSIEAKKRGPDPWTILSSLLGRDYGDAVCVGREDENNRKRAADIIEEEENISKSRSTAIRCSNCKSSNAASVEDVTTSTSNDQFTSPAPIPTVVESDIVAEENEAFEKQLQSLAAKRSRKFGAKSNVTPFSQSRIISLVSSNSTNELPVLPVQKRPSIVRPTEKNKVTYTSVYKSRMAAEAKKCGPSTSNCGPTDFSQVSDSVSPSCSLLLGLRSPEKQPRSSNHTISVENVKKIITDEERRIQETELFGDMSLSPTRFSSFGEKSRDAYTHQHHPTDFDLFGEVSVTPSKASSQLSLSVAESIQGSALFHVTMAEMMNQNSVDFSRNFLPLLENIDHSSPKKS